MLVSGILFGLVHLSGLAIKGIDPQVIYGQSLFAGGIGVVLAWVRLRGASIWPGIIARGKITGLVGYPGLGKSQVAIDVASTVSTGRLWPDGAANGNAGEVIAGGREQPAVLYPLGADVPHQHVADGGDHRLIKVHGGFRISFGRCG